MIISPVRNESRHITAVATAMAAQTRPPDAWIVVDDGSSDETFQLLTAAARTVEFMRVLRAPQQEMADGADRLLHASDAHAFNYGLRSATDYTHIGKIDGDIELPPRYWERLLERFDTTPKLGIAGGILIEPVGNGWEPRGDSNLEHVRGALKLYSRECFAAIGGVREMLGWDGCDEVLARMHGFETRSYPDLVARHHRPAGTAQGRLRGSFRLGRSMYIEGYPLLWVAARSIKVGTSAPRGLSGLVYLAGFLDAAARRVRRFETDGYRRHLHKELRSRALNSLNPLSSG